MLNPGDGNWWTGRLKRNKVIGSFPRNFVELVDNPTRTLSKQKTKSVADLSISTGPGIASPRPAMTHSLSATAPLHASVGPSLGHSQSLVRKSTTEIIADLTEELNRSGGSYSSALNSSGSSHVSRLGDSASTHASYHSAQEEYYGEYSGHQQDGHQYEQEYEGHDNGNGYDGYEQEYQAHDDTYHHQSYEEFDGQDTFTYDEEDPDASFQHGDEESAYPDAPPAPPPHAVPVSGSRAGSEEREERVSTPVGQATNSGLSRTPSPLRNAMDDVLASLEYMDMGERRHSGTTVTEETAAYGNSGYSQRGFVEAQPEPEPESESMDNRDAGHSGFPFDPSSFDGFDSQMARADTFHSVSSLNTNTLSVTSTSTAPTSASGFSSTSAGSLLRRNEAYSRPSLASLDDETPARLPSARESMSTLSVKKPAGFLRKFFAASKSEATPADDSLAVGKLRRTKSRSSITSAISSSKLRDSLKRVSSRKISFHGKSRSESALARSNSWIEVRRDVHRANSMSKIERAQKQRQRELEGFAVMSPYSSFRAGVRDELADGDEYSQHGANVDLRDLDFFDAVDAEILGMGSWPQLMTPAVFASSRIGRRFETDVERIRAIFDFCAAKIAHEQPTPGCDGSAAASASRVLQHKRATPLEKALCVEAMCEALDIPCRVVGGHLKQPGEVWDKPGVPTSNHYWNAVAVDGRWLFVDTALASQSFPDRASYSTCSIDEIDYFYFLTPPRELIFTHVPRFAHDEHLVPPVPLSDALALPLKTPAAFALGIDVDPDFHTALTALDNLEVAEIDFAVPLGVEMYAELALTRSAQSPLESRFGFGTDDSEPNAAPRPGACLAQAYWRDGSRYYRVKAILPENVPLGVLRVYAAETSRLKAFNSSTMDLVSTFGVSHRGQNAPFEFVTRHFAFHGQRHDLYVREPQCKRLAGGSTYKFTVRQHPSRGVTPGAGLGVVKLGVQSPSGRITKLARLDSDSPVAATWEASVKTLEVGVWRGLVLSDNGNAWSVFAEWHCM